MLLDFKVETDSITIDINDPFHPDMVSVMKKIREFAGSKKIELLGCDIEGLIPRMIKGIAGCESGCPANARGLVERGFKNFELEYIEGGILSARAVIEGGKVLSLKMFPEF